MRFTHFLALTITFATGLFAQNYNFAWINNPGDGVELDAAVKFINDSTDAKFVLFTGGFSDFSDTEDFENAASIISKLDIPYYLIPGNSDVQWSGSIYDFIYTFDEDRFIFEFENEIFIGLNSAIHWRGDGGHIYPEDLAWLEDQLKDIKIDKRIYIFVSNPLYESTDNWFRITNIIKAHNIQAIFCGGGEGYQLIKLNKIPEIKNCPLTFRKNKEWCFTLISNDQDSLIFYNVDNNNARSKWISINKKNNPGYKEIVSPQFNSFSSDVILNLETNFTLIAEPIYRKDKIYTADYTGLLSCYDTAGNFIWNYDSYGNIASKPTIADNIFSAATLQGDLITLNAETGEQIQTIGFDDQITSSLITIEYAGTKDLLLPKYTDSKSAVILGTSEGIIYCYDLETLQEYWMNSDAGGRIINKPIHVDNKIIYGSWDGYLYCIDSREGWLIWKWTANDNLKYSPAGCQPVFDGEKIYVTTTEGIIYAIDLQLGKTIWQTEKFESWESAGINQNKNRILVKTIDGKLNIVETTKGTNRKTIDLKTENDKTPIAPIAWDGNIFVPSGNGSIYKIDNKFNVEEILFMGIGAINSFQHIKENIFLASNIDGRITLFKIN